MPSSVNRVSWRRCSPGRSVQEDSTNQLSQRLSGTRLGELRNRGGSLERCSRKYPAKEVYGGAYRPCRGGGDEVDVGGGLEKERWERREGRFYSAVPPGAHGRAPNPIQGSKLQTVVPVSPHCSCPLDSRKFCIVACSNSPLLQPKLGYSRLGR